MFNPALITEFPRTAYPERIRPTLGWCDRQAERLAGLVTRRWRKRRMGWQGFLQLVARSEGPIQHLNGQGIANHAEQHRRQFQKYGFHDEWVAQAFALIRFASQVTIGQRHFDVQLLGGRVLLRGMIAEMETGEGKTLTATLAAGAAALAGIPVHVITVNDYLAKRDAEWMKPIFQALGLSVGIVTHGMSPNERMSAYRCDVTYCSNKEIAFDYLKDRIVLGREPGNLRLNIEQLGGKEGRLGRLLLRGLHFGIVDEADSVLIDEAKTPLIISGPAQEAPEQKVYLQALEIARQLQRGKDFTLHESEHQVRFTEVGCEQVAAGALPLGGVWNGRNRREDLIRQALSALHFFHRDKQYLVQEGKVHIIDEYTGRLMSDRSWEHGLHQLIETKEGCELGARQDPLARMTYQRFFRRFLRLSGMTGTAQEVESELWKVYRLPVRRIPTNRPLARSSRPDQIFHTLDEKWQGVVQRVQEVNRMGRPILIGTRSVEASEQVSAYLTAAHLPHQVLNARQDQDEAQIIEQAGEPKRITLATNMAGRGTDIRLGPGVTDLGGLCVIATERHEAHRIDRQLFGRCGRQGDPGSFEMMVSLEDELVTVFVKGWWWHGVMWIGTRFRRMPRIIGRLVFLHAQRVAERQHRRMRRDLLKSDEQLETTLAFSGHLE